ncbi:Glucosamine 6-phosphate N-acetyltransferase [Plasmodiophora brassicae]
MDDGTSLRLRDLEPGDFNKGYIALLQQLTDVGDVDFAAFSAQFSAMDRGSYKTVVIEDTSISKVIASATVFVERKFIHSCGKVGHIEDVVTSSDYRGKRLGHRVVDSCVKWAFAAGCYKVILDCKPELKQFYEKVGFEHRQIQMSIYDLAAP